MVIGAGAAGPVSVMVTPAKDELTLPEMAWVTGGVTAGVSPTMLSVPVLARVVLLAVVSTVNVAPGSCTLVMVAVVDVVLTLTMSRNRSGPVPFALKVVCIKSVLLGRPTAASAGANFAVKAVFCTFRLAVVRLAMPPVDRYVPTSIAAIFLMIRSVNGLILTVPFASDAVAAE